jgi:hypothetical protein
MNVNITAQKILGLSRVHMAKLSSLVQTRGQFCTMGTPATYSMREACVLSCSGAAPTVMPKAQLSDSPLNCRNITSRLRTHGDIEEIISPSTLCWSEPDPLSREKEGRPSVSCQLHTSCFLGVMGLYANELSACVTATEAGSEIKRGKLISNSIINI